jgi:hypothetical protein
MVPRSIVFSSRKENPRNYCYGKKLGRPGIMLYCYAIAMLTTARTVVRVSSTEQRAHHFSLCDNVCGPGVLCTSLVTCLARTWRLHSHYLGPQNVRVP